MHKRRKTSRVHTSSRKPMKKVCNENETKKQTRKSDVCVKMLLMEGSPYRAHTKNRRKRLYVCMYVRTYVRTYVCMYNYMYENNAASINSEGDTPLTYLLNNGVYLNHLKLMLQK